MVMSFIDRGARERGDPSSSPLHFALGNLGAELQCDLETQAGVQSFHCSDQGTAVVGFGHFCLVGEQVIAGECQAVGPGIRDITRVARDNDLRFAGDQRIEFRDPVRAIFRGRGIRHPDMQPLEDINAAEHGFERRYP